MNILLRDINYPELHTRDILNNFFPILGFIHRFLFFKRL
jgi:hypothetical protein